MNNGRDCPHGRQAGKCDTCDLIKAELELQQVTSERDAYQKLADSMAALMVKHKRVFTSKELKEAECHLSAHDAEVAAKAIDGFIDDIGYLDGLTPQCIFKQAKEYAAQLRANAGA